MQLNDFNARLAKVNNILLIGILILLPLGLIYQSISAAIFVNASSENMSSIGILQIVLITSEIYIGLFYIWLRLLRNRHLNEILLCIQLLIIGLFGVIPGILMLYPAFFVS